MRFYDRKEMFFPDLLRSKIVENNKDQINEYINSVHSKGGQRRAPHYQKIIENYKLQENLSANFNKACAYCERLTSQKEGSVTHHRPPGLAADKKGKTELLNYVWLTYQWENLYWVCNRCERRKSNKFFVRSHSQLHVGLSINELRKIESELFLDPCYHMVQQHILFLPNGYLKPKSKAGSTTIDLFELNHIELQKSRIKTSLQIVKLLRRPGKVKIFLTGSPLGISDALLLKPDKSNNSDIYNFFPHIGAVCQSLISWGASKDSSIMNCRTLLDSLDQMHPTNRQSWLDNYESQVLQTSNALPQAPTRTIKQYDSEYSDSSRLFNLSAAPLAESIIGSVKIHNFKGINKIELILPNNVEDSRLVPCALILGENATGKSSILEAITLALLGTDEITQLNRAIKFEDISPSELLHRPNHMKWDAPINEGLSISINYVGKDFATNLIAKPGDDHFAGDRRSAKILLAYGPRRYFSKKNMRRFRAPEYRVRSLFDPLATLPNPVDWMLRCDIKSFEASVRALREVLLLDKKADVLRDHENSRIMIDTPQGLTPLLNLSEGYKSVVSMAVDIIRELLTHYDNLENASAVVLIDEIETHLHPRWKMLIIQRLRQAFPKVQFIITTHDPLCLRGMYQGEVFVLKRDHETGRINSLENLPDVRGMRAEQILTSEFFGLGSTDPVTDAKLIRYQALSSDAHRTEGDTDEMKRLQEEISNSMNVGDSLQQQLMNDAFRKANIDPLAPIDSFSKLSRHNLIEDLVSVITNIESNHKEDPLENKD
ncbi:MAG: AAA family ATPase [Alcanivoracaceae bacterium]|nr:AAA family ATPase [Alcanivoracaceae bacterium]